ncbi:MAG: hypothetical protein WA130_11260 [Candidatus Methanoperedens sp.]
MAPELPKEVYVVVHMFQGIVDELKVFLDRDMARDARDKKIIEEYGELVEEQCGKYEFILGEAEVFPADKDNIVLLDRVSIQQALVERIKNAGMHVPVGTELDKMTEDFCHWVDDGLSDFMDDRFKAFNEETSERGG